MNTVGFRRQLVCNLIAPLSYHHAAQLVFGETFCEHGKTEVNTLQVLEPPQLEHTSAAVPRDHVSPLTPCPAPTSLPSPPL